MLGVNLLTYILHWKKKSQIFYKLTLIFNYFGY